MCKWAIAQGYRKDNPAGEAIGAALPKSNGVQKHHRALPYAEVGAAVAKVRESGASTAVKLCFEFLVLTACRSGEIRFARWDEIDLAAAAWTIPAERMKAKREHRVPLSDRAVEVLQQAREIADGSGLVFPTPTGKALSDSTLSKLIRELCVAAVPHGFRSSFRDWCSECSNVPREVAEAVLAHVVRNKAEAAYARSDLFEPAARAHGRLGGLPEPNHGPCGADGAPSWMRTHPPRLGVGTCQAEPGEKVPEEEHYAPIEKRHRLQDCHGRSCPRARDSSVIRSLPYQRSVASTCHSLLSASPYPLRAPVSRAQSGRDSSWVIKSLREMMARAREILATRYWAAQVLAAKRSSSGSHAAWLPPEPKKVRAGREGARALGGQLRPWQSCRRCLFSMGA